MHCLFSVTRSTGSIQLFVIAGAAPAPRAYPCLSSFAHSVGSKFCEPMARRLFANYRFIVQNNRVDSDYPNALRVYFSVNSRYFSNRKATRSASSAKLRP